MDINYALILRDPSTLSYDEMQELRELIMDRGHRYQILNYLKHNNVWVASIYDMALKMTENRYVTTEDVTEIVLLVLLQNWRPTIS